MATSFELFIARRYLKARRKEAVISVITAISILGVAAGVMALVVALAINNGFRDTLQRNLLGAMAHINIQEKEPLNGIENWEAMVARIAVWVKADGFGPSFRQARPLAEIANWAAHNAPANRPSEGQAGQIPAFRTAL